MTEQQAYIAIVDDDESVRESLPDLVREFGYDAEGFSSAEEFLRSNKVKQSACLILDIAMPGMSGLELQRQLRQHGETVPIVFITAHGDDMACEKIRASGAGCLLKPFSDTELLQALQDAVGPR